MNSSFSYCEIRLGNEKRSASDISRGFCSMSVFYYMAFPLTAVGKVLFSFGSFASLLFLIGWSARVTGIFDGVLFG